MEESETILSDYLLKYIAIHTLNGELYLDKLINQQKYRMYIIKEIGYCIFSVFFDANTIVTTAAASASSASLASEVDSDEKPQTTLNCLSLILPFNENKPNVLVDHYGDTQFLINSFENMILEYKIYAQIKPKQRKTTSAIQDLTQLIKKFCLNLNMLRLRGIHPISNYSADLKSPNRISIKDTFLDECYFTTPSYSSICNDFLVNAISSHIISNFNTIVIGKTSATVNKMINTLALFSPKEKLKLSCYALEEAHLLCPYYALQGFVTVTENPDELHTLLDADFIFRKDSPITIVDLTFKHVLRTPILNEFTLKKDSFTNKKVQFLYNSLTFNDLNAVYPIKLYLNTISNSLTAHRATLITSTLKQMDVLESDYGVRDSYLDMIQKDFIVQALNLIEYINNELINSMSKKEKDMRVSMKKVCKDLDIKSDEDLHILIAYANYVKPGFTSNLVFQ